jgi:ADP-ribose pyrophosphatase YjhB (NUDIX family)
VGAGALVHKGGRLLLVKRNERPSKGMWSFPGGALELGETTADTAVREIKEETGLDIVIERLFDVVNYLPYERGASARNQVIVIDYLARPRRGRVRLNRESSDFGWFTPEQVEKLWTTKKVKECADKFAKMRVR